jgi:Mg2+ and Co2+ transporter CorA
MIKIGGIKNMDINQQLEDLEKRVSQNEKNIDGLYEVISRIIKRQNEEPILVAHEEDKMSMDTLKDIQQMYLSNKIEKGLALALCESIVINSEDTELISLADDMQKLIKEEELDCIRNFSFERK